MTDVPTFDPSMLHEKARGALDADGSKLLQFAVSTPLRRALRNRTFPSRREPVDTITDSDIIGEPMLAYSDWSGSVVARYYVRDGQEVTLKNEGYIALRRLVEKVRRARPFSSCVSDHFVEEEIFRWWRGALRGELIEITLSDHLIAAAEQAVSEHEILVPITAIEIERPFFLGEVLVTPIDKGLLDRFGSEAATRSPENAEMILRRTAELRQEIGHLTAVTVRTFGDRHLAQQRAQRVALDMTAVLRFMCPAAVSWNVFFPCFRKGSEHLRSNMLIEVKDGQIVYLSQGLLGRRLISSEPQPH